MVVTDDQGRYVVPDLPQGEIQSVGARLRARQFAEAGWRARQAAQSARRRRAERGRRGEILSRHLLVFDAEDSGREPVRRQGRSARQRQAARLSQPDEEQRLHRLSPARPALHPHDPEISQRRTLIGAKPGCTASSPARPASSWSNILAGQLAAVPIKYYADWTDRIAQGRAAARQAARVRKGVERNIVVTTWDWGDEKHYLHDLDIDRTGATPRSTPTARSTARRNTRPT